LRLIPVPLKAAPRRVLARPSVDQRFLSGPASV